MRRIDAHAARRAPMRDGNTRKLRRRNRRSHPRDDGAKNARRRQRGKLLAAPAEHEGIAPFEPHGERIFFCAVDQNRVDFALRDGVRPRALADENALAVLFEIPERALVDEAVVHHAVASAEQLRAAHGEKSPSAARAHEHDPVHESSSARRAIVSSPA